ncbi:ArsR/SmtB family transcription factor [Luteipulveratus halotolerans]|uniref:ArsR family transcriptional regulator n=1 Tax=Luteipulveratus halotolerans TaxID=1631356 RepID=A0A0L6CDC6_9MICO|nr:metalloregulator ArsR/SmtB family transcription factor [Luteipulveratus halotolerans]KNX35891.1 ArsR family transcriptional regulator [Luteipulveratus halotolerans]
MAITTINGDTGGPLDEALAATAAACLFRGMSDPSRVAILQHLLLGEHKVAELTEHLGLAQSTVSKHLACLRDCGLVTSRPVGRASMFAVRHPDAVAKVLAVAEELLALTDDAVMRCSTASPAARGNRGLTGDGR